VDTGAPGRPGGGAQTSRERTKLHLGVLVQPYYRRSLTTGDVASILEAKYGIMAAFYRVHGPAVAQAIGDSLAGALEARAMGAAVDPWGRGTQKIETMFKTFISSQEVERVGIPGVPTAAALRGVNHRLKHPYAKANARRPSFRDTGLYMGSFRAWVS
jgi:hypothetical protein